MTNIAVESVTVPVPVVFRWREMPPYFRGSVCWHARNCCQSISDLLTSINHCEHNDIRLHEADWT